MNSTFAMQPFSQLPEGLQWNHGQKFEAEGLSHGARIHVYIADICTHTCVCFQKSSVCSACKTPESILHHEEYHIVSSHGWPNFQWMNEANMFMMAWKWQESIISYSLTPPPPPSANQQPQLQISNEKIIWGSFVPLSFKNNHDVLFRTHLSMF